MSISDHAPFVAIKANDEALRPRKPDELAEPDLYRNWQTMMVDSHLQIVTPHLKGTAPLPKRLQLSSNTRGRILPRASPRTTGPVHLHQGRPQLSSRNWSGGLVMAQSGRRFTRIAGTWVIPHDVAKPSAPGRVSIFVGLGGQYPWSRSMPQMGSEHTWDGSAFKHTLWCQWWRGPSGGWLSCEVSNIEATAGDMIACDLAVAGRDLVTFHFKNLRTHELAGVMAMGPGLDAAGASAEWVVERPTRVVASGPNGELGTDGLHQLPAIGTVTISGCAARLQNPARSDIRARTLRDAETICLLSAQSDPSRLVRELDGIIRPDGNRPVLDIYHQAN